MAGDINSNILSYQWSDYDKTIKPTQSKKENEVENLTEALEDGKLTKDEISTLKSKYINSVKSDKVSETAAEEEFNKRLTSIIGEKGFTAYKQAESEPVAFTFKKKEDKVVVSQNKNGTETETNSIDASKPQSETQNKVADSNDFARAFGSQNGIVFASKELRETMKSLPGESGYVHKLQDYLKKNGSPDLAVDGSMGVKTLEALSKAYKEGSPEVKEKLRPIVEQLEKDNPKIGSLVKNGVPEDPKSIIKKEFDSNISKLELARKEAMGSMSPPDVEKVKTVNSMATSDFVKHCDNACQKIADKAPDNKKDSVKAVFENYKKDVGKANEQHGKDIEQAMTLPEGSQRDEAIKQANQKRETAFTQAKAKFDAAIDAIINPPLPKIPNPTNTGEGNKKGGAPAEEKDDRPELPKEDVESAIKIYGDPNSSEEARKKAQETLGKMPTKQYYEYSPKMVCESNPEPVFPFPEPEPLVSLPEE